MFYYLFHYLDQHFNFPGAGVFQYISFRAALALLSSLVITMIFGKRIINYIRKKQIGETIRELGLEGQKVLVPFNSSTLIKDFIFEYTQSNNRILKPIYDVPLPVVYRIYLDDGHVHVH